MQLLQPGCDREKNDERHERLAGCIVERSQRRQIRLQRVRDAPVRDRTPVRNRSTEALLKLSVRTASGGDRVDRALKFNQLVCGTVQHCITSRSDPVATARGSDLFRLTRQYAFHPCHGVRHDGS